jgi:Leucine-rich repeat (LRR) protein
VVKVFLRDIRIIACKNGFKILNRMGNSNSFPQKLETAKKTLTLTFNENEIEIPIEIFQLVKLKNLDISNNRLRTLAPSFQNFQQLKNLVLDGNKLTELSDIVFLPTLEKLSVAQNRLAHISDKIQACKNLKQLNLSKNELQEIGNLALPNLISLDISSNQIKRLSSFNACIKLETIDCSDNQLQYISAFEICLKSLKLSNNQLVELPADLLLNTALVFVDIQGNPSDSLEKLQGYEDFIQRRKDRMDQFLRT